MSHEPDPKPVTLRRFVARDGHKQYSEPVIIHSSSRKRVEVVFFYIPRSDGTEVALKIETFTSGASPAPWVMKREASTSLNQAASVALLRAMNEHISIARYDDPGSYLILKGEQGVGELADHDPDLIAKAIATVLAKSDIVAHLSKQDLPTEMVAAFRGAIRIRELRTALSTLRNHLTAGQNDESIYQEWCKKHFWAFGTAYLSADDIRNIGPHDNLDLMAPHIASGARDIVELKRPDAAVLQFDNKHRNHYFSAEVSRAIGQVHRYMDVLAEVARRGMRDHPEIVAYHPRAVIVIGRSSDWPVEQQMALHGLNQRLHGISVMTYDHLLAQGENLVHQLSARTEEAQIPTPAVECHAQSGNEPHAEADDDIPW